MAELIDDEDDDKPVTSEEAFLEDPDDEIGVDDLPHPSDARRRLEDLLDEKRLQDELKDFFDYDEL